jgi:hypothetical protein
MFLVHDTDGARMSAARLVMTVLAKWLQLLRFKVAAAEIIAPRAMGVVAGGAGHFARRIQGEITRDVHRRKNIDGMRRVPAETVATGAYSFDIVAHVFG